MDILRILEQQGLSEKEASVYLALLQFEEALPSVVARKAGVKRPTCYVILEQLQKMGLVSHVKRGGVLHFRALHPQAYVNDQQGKMRSLEKALPELLRLRQQFVATPQMTIYEGNPGLKKIMDDTLTAKTELFCWADVSLAVNSLADYYPSYIERKVKRKLWLRGVISYDPLAVQFKELGEAEFREIYLIPKEKFPFHNEINIYDDKVAIISHQDQVGIIIQNQYIADTQRSIFKLGFEYAKMVEEREYPGLQK